MSIRALPEELQEIAKNELNEDSNRIQDDLNHIREWPKKQLYLKYVLKNCCINSFLDDQSLLNFLRNAKFSLERTKEKIDKYYTMSSIAPELYDRDPLSSELQEILRRGILSVIIDKSNPSLPVVIVHRWEKTDPEIFSCLNILKVFVMLLDIIVTENDNIIISGMHYVADIKGFPVACLPQLTPSICKTFIMSIQDVSPVRLNSIHCLNVLSIFQPIIELAKSFMKEKMTKRLYIHGKNYKDLYQHIPISVIPKDYGGEACLLDEVIDEWKKKVESYRS